MTSPHVNDYASVCRNKLTDRKAKLQNKAEMQLLIYPVFPTSVPYIVSAPGQEGYSSPHILEHFKVPKPDCKRMLLQSRPSARNTKQH